MTSECYYSLSFICCKIFKIDQTDIFFSHCPEHFQIMRLFLCNMGKKQIFFPGDKSSFINLFNTHKNITIPKVLPKRNVQIFIFFIWITSEIAWLDKEFNIRIELLKSYNLRWCERHPSVGRILCFPEYSNSQRFSHNSDNITDGDVKIQKNSLECLKCLECLKYLE